MVPVRIYIYEHVHRWSIYACCTLHFEVDISRDVAGDVADLHSVGALVRVMLQREDVEHSTQAAELMASVSRDGRAVQEPLDGIHGNWRDVFGDGEGESDPTAGDAKNISSVCWDDHRDGCREGGGGGSVMEVCY